MSEPEPELAEADADPFAEEMAEEAAVEDGPGGILGMFLSTTPEVSPQEAADQVDLDAGWQGHTAAGLMKATNTRGTPAFAHFAIAMLLLYQEVNQQQSGDGDGEGEPDRDMSAPPAENPNAQGEVDPDELPF